MAGGVLYLDIDDEITSAATRIRTVEGRRVAVVLPYGSRVATSRINFRLLARDAMTHEKGLSIISGDAGTRALAASAGLPVFATVGEYEASLGTGAAGPDRPLEGSETVVTPPDARIAAGAAGAAVVAGTGGTGATGFTAAASAAGTAGSPVPRAEPLAPAMDTGTVTHQRSATTTTTPVAPSPARAPSGGGSGARTQPVSRVSGRGIGRGAILIGVGVLSLAVVVGGVAAFLLLPSATVVVTPREETIGPVALRISASTEIDAPDVTAGLVPADVVTIDVQAQDTFPATGKRVEQEKATGTVEFLNLDPTSSNTIAKGAVVGTQAGIQFRTNAAVTIPAAELVGITIVPASATVKVTAADAGPDGNVATGAIQVVPRGESGIFLKVTNPDPTTGGTREEFPRITQEDVDGAVSALGGQLSATFADRLDDEDLVTGDVTVFPETAALGPATPTTDPEELVGDEVESFELSATASGTVTTVDAAPVREIAEARLAASVDAGHEMVDGSSEITEAPAVVEGDTITYPVVATARQIAILDPADLEARILGKPLAEADAILGAYGDVDMEVWPDWVGTIPTIDSRVEVTVAGPTPTPDPSQTPDPSP
jgi:hypothetical protein